VCVVCLSDAQETKPSGQTGNGAEALTYSRHTITRLSSSTAARSNSLSVRHGPSPMKQTSSGQSQGVVVVPVVVVYVAVTEVVLLVVDVGTLAQLTKLFGHVKPFW
jgi:hypothetical protein